MIEAVEKHLRDARHVATPETSEKRSGEHAEGKTKRAKSSSNDGEILEARESIEEVVTRETQVLDAAAPGQLPDVEGMEEDEGNYSASTLAAVQNLREQINVFTSQVSNLLDAGKAAFMEMHNKWEEKIVFLHQQQMEEWEEGIEFLNGVDSLNEDINKRLQSAQMVIGFIHPATDDA